MSRIDLENAAGMRTPAAEETGKIARYYQCLYRKRILLCKRLSTIFIVLGLLCLFGYTAGGWVSVVVGIVFFLLVYVARQTAGHEIRQMFTPFMLTEEALTGTMI